MAAFDKAWGVAKYKVEGIDYDDDPKCGDCEVPIPDGNQYGCERCGKDFCEECMADDQYGYPGYRGYIDDDIHPAYANEMRGSGAYCPECASEIVQEYEDEEKERMEEKLEIEADAASEAASRKNDQRELDRKLSEQPFFGSDQEGKGGNRGKMLGRDESPNFHSKFHPDWQDKLASKDSFESAWDIAKEAPIDECKGCGLAHGTPNSEYCSEICERQNKQNKVYKAEDWDTSFKPNATWSQEDINRLNARNDKARGALKNKNLNLVSMYDGLGDKKNALDRALIRARRENAKPKPKLRITRPEDWE